MAKVTSLFHVSGDVGDAAFIQKDGQCFLKTPSRIPKSRIASAPEFQRTRENNMEFGGAVIAASSLRGGLTGVLRTFADKRMTNRLSSKLGQLLKQAAGTRGQRPIDLSLNRAWLRGFELNKEDKFGQAFAAPYQVAVTTSRDAATITIPVFDVNAHVGRPQGATHFRFVLAIGTVSDFAYDASALEYMPVSPEIGGLGAVERSADFSYDVPVTAPVTLAANLPTGTVMPATGSLIVAVGIEFYQIVDTQLYILSQGNAMKIHDLY